MISTLHLVIQGNSLFGITKLKFLSFQTYDIIIIDRFMTILGVFLSCALIDFATHLLEELSNNYQNIAKCKRLQIQVLATAKKMSLVNTIKAYWAQIVKLHNLFNPSMLFLHSSTQCNRGTHTVVCKRDSTKHCLCNKLSFFRKS